MSNGVKTRFAGLLRELLRRFDENETGAGTPQPSRSVAPTAPPPPSIPPIQQFAPPRPKPAPAPASPPTGGVTDLELPLPSVLEGLPPQLRDRLALPGIDLSRASISISVGKIMPQLALGVVKITFGELRQAAPTLFNVNEEYDSLPVVLPLSDVLSRLSSHSLIRNPAQKHINLPEDIAGPFSGNGEGISISGAQTNPPPASVPPMRKITPASSAPVKASPPPVAPPPPAFVVSRAMKPEPQTPPPASNGNGNGNRNGNGNGNGNGMPFQPMSIIPTLPVQSNVPAAPVAPIAPIAPKPAPLTPPVPEPAAILAPLAALSESWPDTLRMEIAQLTLTNAVVALPLNLVETALKRGRVTFNWRNLRSWIKPTPPAFSVHDTLELELPLKVVAPLFLAKQRGATETAKPHQSSPLPAEIPNLFFGFPQPQPPYEIPAPPAKAPVPEETHFTPKPVEAKRSDTNYYIWMESDTTSVAARPSETEFNRTPTPATDFSSRFATPKEVVARAMALNGVAGALVALPDGLMVASDIPSDLNADTLAAFLPQIYGRVSQCTKELRMGGLNNLNFTVGNVPWKIFRVNGVYFAAFGHAGEQLPTAQLVQLAGELDRKTQ